MKATYRVLAYLIPVIVALQASFIALGVFGLGKYVEDGNDFTKSVLENGGSTGDVGFAMHSFGAMAAALVALLLLIVSFFAKIEGGVRAALFVFLDVVLQWVLAFVSFGVWAVGVLHGAQRLPALRPGPDGRGDGDPVHQGRLGTGQRRHRVDGVSRSGISGDRDEGGDGT